MSSRESSRPFRFRPRLLHKGLFLIGALIAVEMGFIIALESLVDQAEAEARREAQAKAIIARTTGLASLSYDAGGALARYCESGDPALFEKYDRASSEARQTLQWLKEALRDDPEEARILAEIETGMTTGMDILDKTRKSMEGQPILVSLVSVARARQKLQPILDEELIPNFLKLKELEEKIAREAPLAQQRARANFRHILHAGLAANVLFAVVLCIAFVRGITSRLNVLVDNTHRLSSRDKLRPPVAGSDEIAELDRTFHHMAGQLEEAARLRQSFVSMIGHDVKNSITAVQGFLTLLAVGALGETSDKARDKAERCERESMRLMALINDLLDLERMETGQLTVNKEKVSLQDVFEQCGDALRGLADRAGVNLEFPAGDLEIQADGRRLVQVCVNLIGNAIKFSPTGGTVTCTWSLAPGWLEVRIADQGRGIPEEYITRIFERFQQVERKDETEKGGSGLGLAICKAIIERHDGTIGVDSMVGKGSTFWFRLPHRG